MFHVYNGNNACACACDSERWLPQLSDGSHMQSLYTLLVPTSNMLENRRTDNVTISNDLHFLSFKKNKKDSVLPWVCIAIDHRKRQIVVEQILQLLT